MSGENEQIRAEVDKDGIATITLARPDKRNALSIRLRQELMDTLAAWADDEQVRVVMLTGEGPAFSAGFDLSEFGQPELARTTAASWHRTRCWTRRGWRRARSRRLRRRRSRRRSAISAATRVSDSKSRFASSTTTSSTGC